MGEVSEGHEPAEQQQEKEEEEKGREKEPAEQQQEKEEEETGRHHNEESPSKPHFNSTSSAASPVAPDDDKGLQQSTTVFVFWAYVVAFVSLLTLAFILFSSIFPSDHDTEFLSMPPAVRDHFSKGKLLKLDVGKDRLPLKVFVREEGPLINSECVLLLHGLGASSFTYRNVISSLASRGLHVIALDFPGAGLSEKPVDDQGGLFSKLKDIYREISEKGLFWRFEQMFETGSFPDPQLSSNKGIVHYDAEELSESIAQVISLLASSPVHIVLHDTSVEAGLTWAIRNPSLVRSIMLIDAYPGFPSFPAGLLGLPGLGFMISKSSTLHQMLLRLCCVVTQLTQVEAGYHAFLLRNNAGKPATLRTWKMANTTFDVVSSIGKLRELPLHIVWSNSSGKDWQELGDWLVSQLSTASHTSHNGGRWPQEDAALQITEEIYLFISSLPQTVHTSEVDLTSQHTQKTFSEGSVYHGNIGHHFHTCDHGHGDHNHEHEHHHNTHNQDLVHDNGLGYMDNMGHGGWVM